MKNILLLLALTFSTLSYGQIAMPEGFTCENKDGKPGEYFSDGKYHVSLRQYRDEGLREDELLGYFMHKMHISPIAGTDGVYVWRGRYKGKYRYIMFIPDLVMKIEINSENTDPQFSKYPRWLMEQVKKCIDNRERIHLTTHDGKKCA